MKVKVSRHDLSYLVSIGLLVAASVTIITGIMADWWDLNEFIYHKYAGYVLALLSLLHVYLHWQQLVSYVRRRLYGRSRRPARSPTPRQNRRAENGRLAAVEAAAPSQPEKQPTLRSISRRDFIPLILGGVSGFSLGYLLRPQPTLPYGGDVGTIYHEWSKPKLLTLLGRVADWGQKPPQYKEYNMKTTVSLPTPDDFRGLHTEEAIRQRRSTRNFSQEEMSQAELSRLLFNTGGINAERQGYRLRAAPSAGALYPIEVYAVIHRVEGLQPGLYHYTVADHALTLLQAADLRGEITRHGLAQGFLGEANLVLIFTAVLQRLRWKYKTRSYRYAMLEAGHLGQNVYLAGTSMGMGVCAVGAFMDDDLNEMLGVDGEEEAAVYILAVGKV